MNPAQLGRRIREARLAKKMTQSEVVGDYITRNMLSLIESGAATPSMSTLEYLAERLELSLPALMAEEPKEPLERLLAAKNALRSKAFREVVELLGEPRSEEPLYDEYCALLARAYGGLAEEGSEQAAVLAAYYRKAGLYGELR